MMLQLIFSGIFTFIVFSLSIAEAAFVKYIDRKGKEHYVNTYYTKVPDEYLGQVRDQISAAKQKSPDIPENDVTQNLNTVLPHSNDIPETSLQAVEVFISTNCKECDRLETLLKANRIKYMHYDVQATSMGKEFYSTMGNTPLPITRIGDKLISGNNITAIKNILEAPVETQSENSQINTENQNEQND